MKRIGMEVVARQLWSAAEAAQVVQAVTFNYRGNPLDPSLLAPEASPYARLPGGHRESWSDAFCNAPRDVYDVTAGGRLHAHRPATFATFQDGYAAACLVDAILDSHRRGGSWVDVRAAIPEKAR